MKLVRCLEILAGAKKAGSKLIFRGSALGMQSLSVAYLYIFGISVALPLVTPSLMMPEAGGISDIHCEL